MKLSNTDSKLARYLSLAIAAIFCLLPFHALLTTWIGSNTGHLDLLRIWKEILMVAMTPLAAFILLTTPELKQWFFKSPLLWLFRAYILLHLALGWYALAHHQLTAIAFIYALIINLRFLVFFTICYIVAARSHFLKTHWRTLLIIPASIVVGFGLLQRFFLPYDFLKHFGYGPKTIPAYQTVDSDLNFQRIQSTLRGANPLGAYLVLFIPVLLFMKRGLVKSLSLLAAVAVLFYSYSRSAWIGVLIACIIIGLWRFKGSRWLKETALAILVIIGLAGIGFYALKSNHTAQDALFHTSSSSTNVSSNAERATAIKDGFRDVVHQPLGRGPGTAGPASFRNSGHSARIAENYYLQIGQEVGVLGVGLFVSINALVAKELWTRRKDTLAQILLASLVGISFVNLVSHAWTDDTLSLLWWGLAGICLAPTLASRPHKPAVKRS